MIDTGNYLARGPDDAAKLHFEGRRNFVVVAAYAYSAGGLIGSEHNGVAILDADDRQVVADRIRIGDGRGQREVLGRLRATDGDWPSFCREFEAVRAAHADRFRYVPADVREGLSGGSPKGDDPVMALIKGNPAVLPAGKDIRTGDQLGADADDGVPYSFPETTRDAMIVAIGRHAKYRETYGKARLSWDIKVRGYDDTGRNDGRPGEEVDARLDDVWEIMRPEDAFGLACGDALSSYLEGEASTYPGDDGGDWRFSVLGRSGGHLVLERWRDVDMSFGSIEELVGTLRGIDDESLARLYGGLRVFDVDLAEPGREISHQINFMRSCDEDRWRAEPEAFLAELVEKVTGSEAPRGVAEGLDAAARAAVDVFGKDPAEFLSIAAQVFDDAFEMRDLAQRIGIERADFVRVAEEHGLDLDGLDLDDYAPDAGSASPAP